MGIKPTYIKSLAQDMMKTHAGRFSGDFEQNKQVVSEFSVIDSKCVRNRVAGYITRKQNTKRTSA
ncbi:30S ribosomal protein S17e [Methanofollis aquaemaris]|uniref:Small ribosomal subunit protein eS17 n=1 Tax=Methanofollis aquaemaris TaxID=126734 RepID=A0A8A3S312_9EURY|nr:30S ribosomal protein S17e [Methanofollis aquaemaris]QSZ66452.1 30S ribosomal protein S17e [Methanofollis aquaemaris]